MRRGLFGAWVLTLAVTAGASAQAVPSEPPPAQNQAGTPAQTSTTRASETRPATTTFLGDTGLWFVPTGEVLGHGKWSFSGYRRGTNYVPGFTNVGDFAGTFGIGIGDRAEIFGSFLFDTRIDRDLRPLFSSDPEVGGVVPQYPRVREYWTGDNVGDLFLGGKVNLWSESRQNPAALAVRGIVKLPTGDEDAGVSTGKPDLLVDFVASKETARFLELAGYAGFELRGQPDDFDMSASAFRWGVGAGVASRSPLQGVFELSGVVPADDVLTVTSSRPMGIDGSLAPLVSNSEAVTRATAALTWRAPRGFFVGGGLGWNVPTRDRDRYSTQGDEFGDFVDWQVRVGFHPGSGVYVPPPPPPPPAPPPPANRAPSVTAQCDPCTVEIGRTSTLTATATDPDGDSLTYRWAAPTGVLATPAARQSLWTAPQQEGTVVATVTVDDGRGGTASDSVNIQVTRPVVKEYTFEDVHFDFDRFSLRPDATRLLDEAVSALQQDAALRLQIEGHTCNIGTAEYNLALGDRRANSVRDYLMSRGVAADRLTTVSYGEERPSHDNTREETRRLNRRAALVVNLQR